MSTNPFADYHLVYAVVLVALAAASAGDTLGLGRRWAGLPFVRDHAWLR
jgi:thiosulfate dehydrogenase [quinone] large subunit